MDIIEQAARALEPLSAAGIPVKQGWYDESLKKTHVTLWSLTDSDTGESDDDTEAEDGYLQVNIWTTYDAMSLKKKIKRLLKKANFIYQEGQDVQEKPGLFNKGMRFYKIEETEE
nr:MAG TPA: Protein of unknown function (DUF806) [Caudoviricetes sp.]